ncbi:hypothetical protein V1512DRAFT_246822 [Lipomyces arxii]|uniref:uncharacterized protein n=1 Tax=Lipomyces arxii TaxID=56418 RepID=UPI0034CD4D46
MADSELTCWVCMGTSDDVPPYGLSEHNWRRPCKCTLVAHEACLFNWFKTASPLSSTMACPVCKSPISIVQPEYFSVWIQKFANIVAETTTKNGMYVVCFGIKFFVTKYVAYNLGKMVVRTVLEPEQAAAICYVDTAWDEYLADYAKYEKTFDTYRTKIFGLGLPPAAPTFTTSQTYNDFSNLAMLVQTLLIARSPSTIFNDCVLVWLALSTAYASRETIPQGESFARVLACMPVARYVHRGFKHFVVAPIQRHWENEFPDPQIEELEPEPQPELLEAIEDATDFMSFRTKLPALQVAEAIAFPFISRLVQDQIVKIFPAFSEKVPRLFVRVAISACAVVAVKECADMYLSYAKYQQRKNRIILDYHRTET